jgi:hypothetical protein
MSEDSTRRCDAREEGIGPRSPSEQVMKNKNHNTLASKTTRANPLTIISSLSLL